MKYRHRCEVCGTEAVLTPEEAYQDGWDYPPSFFPFGTVQPHTCGNCSIDKTVWWKLAVEKVSFDELSDEEKLLVESFVGEPDTIEVKEEDNSTTAVTEPTRDRH